MDTDLKVGFTAKIKLLAAEMNLVRAGVLAALDTGCGTRAMVAKLILQGTDRFELGHQLLYTSQFDTRAFSHRVASFDPTRFILHSGVLG